MDLAPGMLVGEYRILARLASGATGTVYAAVHPVIGRRAAVKVLHAHLSGQRTVAARFLREARAANRIRHPGCVDVLGYGRLSDGRCYLVMEHLDGETVKQRLR